MKGKNGVYVVKNGGVLKTKLAILKESGDGVLLVTDYVSIVILKNELSKCAWEEGIKQASKIGAVLPNRHEWIEIHTHKAEINQALKLIGGQPISDEWYWTRDETSTYYSWIYIGINGFLYTNFKNYSTSCRPVTAF